MKKKLYCKSLVIGIIVIFIGAGLSSAYVNVEIKSLIKDNQPPSAPSISGPIEGVVGVEYYYTFKAIDPDYDRVYYYINWGDGQIEEWLGPFDSGEELILSHIWIETGSYEIKAKAKDTYGLESEWETLEISITKSKLVTNSLLQLLNRFANAYPMISFLLKQ